MIYEFDFKLGVYKTNEIIQGNGRQVEVRSEYLFYPKNGNIVQRLLNRAHGNLNFSDTKHVEVEHGVVINPDSDFTIGRRGSTYAKDLGDATKWEEVTDHQLAHAYFIESNK